MSTLRNRKKKVVEESIEAIVEEDSGFSVFDVIRMIVGFLLLNSVVSYVFTGEIDYGYSKLPRATFIRSPFSYIRYNYFHDPISFTLDELALYNGTDHDLPVYISLNDTVYDVSYKRKLYQPGGSYSFYGGKELSFSLATNCLNYKGGIDNVELTPEEIRRLKGWIQFYNVKYFKIGKIINESNELLKYTDREVCIGK